MPTLTKEHFDKQIKRIDKRFDDVEKKVEKEVHGLAAMTAKGFSDLEKRLDVREKVERLEREMKEIRSALHL